MNRFASKDWQQRRHLKGLGIMSGTSLDGLDLALCEFDFDQEGAFEIRKAETIKYNSYWNERLKTSVYLNQNELQKLDQDFGLWICDQAKKFLSGVTDLDFIASHGHTVYHNPEEKVSIQIGDGIQIANGLNTTVVSDFRIENVMEGGQGAPLVPIGDLQLFGSYTHCLNLGGIANISSKVEGNIIAYDVSICNTALNYFSGELGSEFDKGGQLGKKGKVINALLEELNALAYYQLDYPKSLDSSFFYDEVLRVILEKQCSKQDVLRTLYEHISIQISKALDETNSGKVLVTGGGAHNDFLVLLLKSNLGKRLHIPDNTMIDFKEALIFAYMGALKLRNEINCLASVTGSKEDMCVGKVSLPTA